jgi:hypothetical protein
VLPPLFLRLRPPPPRLPPLSDVHIQKRSHSFNLVCTAWGFRVGVAGMHGSSPLRGKTPPRRRGQDVSSPAAGKSSAKGKGPASGQSKKTPLTLRELVPSRPTGMHILTVFDKVGMPCTFHTWFSGSGDVARTERRGAIPCATRGNVSGCYTTTHAQTRV